MLATNRQIVEALGKAEKRLLATTATEDWTERLKLEDEAEPHIELAQQLEKELKALE